MLEKGAVKFDGKEEKEAAANQEEDLASKSKSLKREVDYKEKEKEEPPRSKRRGR